MKGELVEVVTKDGLELRGFFADAKSDIAVLHSHGTAGDFYSHKFIEVEGLLLSKKKISFLSGNNRGHDSLTDIRKRTKKGIEKVTIGGGLEKFEDSLFDIGAWVDFLKNRGVKKIILQGHSLGPNKNIYYGYKTRDERIIGYILLSPQNDAGLMKEILGEKKYFEVETEIKELIKKGDSSKMLSPELSLICPTSALTYSGYFIETGVGNLFPYHNPKNPNWKLTSSLKVPQLLIFGEKDPYIKPSTIKAIEVFKSKVFDKNLFESKLIKNAFHSYVGQEDELSHIIYKWIEKYYFSL